MSKRGRSRWGVRSAMVAVLVVGLCGSTTVGAARRTSEDAWRIEAPTTATLDTGAPHEADATARTATGSAATRGGSESVDTTAPVAVPTRTLRQLRDSELTPALVAKASQIIRHYHDEAVGTEVPFSLDGHDYAGRIERHYHPEGGARKPWGYHPGCTLYAVEIQ